MDAIYVSNLTKKYGKQEILKGINLRIKEGEFYALMGPNGSGKTTLVSIIASVSLPTTGEVKIYGKNPQFMKKIISYVPQENFSSPLLTGKENLIYFAQLLGYSKNEARKMVDEILERMGLSIDGNKRVSVYSGGMRKKLEIATAFFPGTKILILDEPTTGLDPAARRDLLGLIQKMKGDSTILMVTHIGTDAEVANRVGLMKDGRIIMEGEPQKLKRMVGIQHVINIETSTKSKRAMEVLMKLGKEVMETATGYRIYCEKPEEILPEIIREMDKIGCKIIKSEIEEPSLEDVFFKITGGENADNSHI